MPISGKISPKRRKEEERTVIDNFNGRFIYNSVRRCFMERVNGRALASVAFLGFVVVFLSCAAPDRSKQETSLKNVEERTDYQVNFKPSSGHVLVSGPGGTARFAPGVSGFSVNENWYRLSEPPYFKDGEFFLTIGGLNVVREALEAARKRKRERIDGSGFRVVLDPGHGGKYTGARGVNGVKEKNVNLRFCRSIKSFLEERGVTVILTRNTDVAISQDYRTDLDRRVQIANQKEADLFISVHANAARSSSPSGFEIFLSDPGDRRDTINRLKKWDNNVWQSGGGSANGASGPDSARGEYKKRKRMSKRLAVEVKRQVKPDVKTPFRGIKEKSLHVLRNAPCPCVLLELGFLTNPSEARLLTQESYREKLSRSIAKAILNYRREMVE